MQIDEDNDLIDRCLEGSDAALQRLITKYQRDIYTLSYQMAGDMEEAKDITQKTLIKAVGGLSVNEMSAAALGLMIALFAYFQHDGAQSHGAHRDCRCR